MEPHETAMDGETWIREVDALRALARALLRDEHAAEDALHETWLRARKLERRPERPGAWLATVLRNLVRDRRRGEARRRAREVAAAAPERLPSPDEVAERLEVAKRVADSAAALREPYRTAIHLHYFEGLTLAEIAARGGWPLETVRTRVRRGLAELRTRLDGLHGGDRRTWSLALAPLALRPAPSGAAATATGATLATLAGALAVSKTQLAVAVGAAALAATLFVTLRDRSPAAPQRSAAAPSASPREVASLGREDRASSVADTASSQDVRAPAAAAPAEPGDDLIELSGTLVMLDEDGAERHPAEAQLALAIARPGQQEHDAHAQVQVQDGRWTARVHADSTLVARTIWADGRGGDVLTPAQPVPASRSMEIRGAWWPRTFLRVVDAESDVELDGVELRNAYRGFAGFFLLHPGQTEDTELIVAGAPSPIEVRTRVAVRDDSALCCWVRAPGYAWARCDVLLQEGGTRTVLLERACSLEIQALGALPEGELRAVLGADAGTPAARATHVALDPSGSARIEDLPPGAYEVSVIRPSGWHLPLGSTTIELAPGARGLAQVRIEDTETPTPRTHLTGTLRVPEGESVGDLELRPQPRTLGTMVGQEPVRLPPPEMERDASDPTLLRWDAGAVACGTWVATVHGGGLRQAFEAGPGPASFLAIEVPARVDVEVEVVRAGDGRRLEDAELSWAAGTPETAWMWTLLRRPADGGPFRFRAPLGPLVLDVEADGRQPARLEPWLEAGGVNRLRVELVAATGLRLELFEDSARLPVGTAAAHVEDVVTGASAEVLGFRSTATEQVLLLAPGAYRVSVPNAPEGYAPFEPLEVLVRSGEVTPVRLELRREAP